MTKKTKAKTQADEQGATLAFRVPAWLLEDLQELRKWYGEGESREDVGPRGATTSVVARWVIGLGVEVAKALRDAGHARRDVAWNVIAANAAANAAEKLR